MSILKTLKWMLDKSEKTPILVEIKDLDHQDFNREVVNQIADTVAWVIDGVGVSKYVGVLALRNLGKVYLQFQVPNLLFGFVQAAVEKIPEIRQVVIDHKIALEKPSPNMETWGLPSHPSPTIIDNRPYLDIESIWETQAYKDMDTALIVVADTGFGPYPQGNLPDWIGDRLVAAKSFTNEGSTGDAIGHGTHCINIEAGGLSEGKPDYRGLFPKALVAMARVFDQNGYTYESWLLAAADWTAGLEVGWHGKKYKAKVMSNSWGATTNSDGHDTLSEAFDALWRKGVFVGFAMGNSGQSYLAPCHGTIGIPATNFLCVKGGATSGAHWGSGEFQSLVMSFQSQPPTKDGRSYPDIRFAGAPGKAIKGYDARMDGKSGTSFGWPWIAALAALLMAYDPSLTNEQVWTEFIEPTCWEMGYRDHPEKYTPTQAACIEGAGEIRPKAAWDKLLAGEIQLRAVLTVDGNVAFAWPYTGKGTYTTNLNLNHIGIRELRIDLPNAKSAIRHIEIYEETPPPPPPPDDTPNFTSPTENQKFKIGETIPIIIVVS